MKKRLFTAVKFLLVTFTLISSGAALSGQITGSQVDLIKAIVKFQPQYTRDEPPAMDGEYTAWQKFKSTIYGAITGKICNEYSAWGAISSDYTIYGDLRDLVVQSWKYLNNEEVDGIVITLSAYGIVLSAVPNSLKATNYIKGFYKNPIVVLGLSKSHLVIHTLKILKKYHLVGLMIPVMGLFFFLSLLPPYVTVVVFVSSAVYQMVILFQVFKHKGES